MYPGQLSSRFTLFSAYLLVQKYWRIFCHPSQSLLVSPPTNLIPTEYIGDILYFEIEGYMSMPACLNQCVSSVSSRKERLSLFFIYS